MTEIKVILIEDDKSTRLGVEQALDLAGFKVESHPSASLALPEIMAGSAAVVVSDVRLRGVDGLELQQRLLGVDREIPVILMTGHGDVAMAVKAIRQGAYDFIEKPFAPEQLVAAVQRAAEKRRLTLELGVLQKKLKDKLAIESMILGHSSVIEQLRRTVLDLASTEADVLVVGETGVGKELVARCLHQFTVGGMGHLLPSTAAECRKRCSRAKCSDMKKAPSPEPRAGASGKWSMPMVEHFS